jgi:putative transposase
MSLNRSTYHKRRSERAQLRCESDAALRTVIERIAAEWPAYGYRRVSKELRRRGIVANHKRVARIMREQALTAHRVRHRDDG